MGYGTHQFVSSVDPNLLCGVCGGVIEGAVVTPCGHSFCCLCLHTWLARPAALTCPECRAHVPEDSVKPVHSLRNLIRGLLVKCEFSSRGCKDTVKLDVLETHLKTCPYSPVECAGCGQDVNRLDLADHQMTCAGIAASVQEEEEEEERRQRHHSLNNNDEEEDEEQQRFTSAWKGFKERVQMCKSASSTDICILLSRIRALEGRVERLLEELRSARTKNLALEREYEKINAQLKEKQSEIRELQDTEFFLEHEVSRTPQTVAKLSLLIAKHLLQKPRYVDAEKVFSAVRRCYERFYRVRPECEHDVHMLLATAYASNWFTAAHRISIKRWLQSLVRPPGVTRTGSSLFNRQTVIG